MEIIRIPSADSTNSWLQARGDSLEAPCLVYAVEQTAGRGQRGNSWESEPGKNLTATALLPTSHIEPQKQFLISEAVALAVVDFLATEGVEASVKWPNDIYVGNRKICGILIEHSLLGCRITRSVAGFGINVNQREFLSDAPNPVSLVQLTGREIPVQEVAERMAEALSARMEMTRTPEALHREFLSKLWRGDGNMYPFFDRLARRNISARIDAVATDGTLTLVTSTGERCDFAFKEVEFLINDL